MGLDIVHEAAVSKTKKKWAKRTKCKCGSTTYLTANSKNCPLNKGSLLKANVEDKANADKKAEINFDGDEI